MRPITKADLTRLGRAELLSMAEDLLDLEERMRLTKAAEERGEDDETPVCVFCSLVVSNGMIVLAPTGAGICVGCTTDAFAAFAIPASPDGDPASLPMVAAIAQSGTSCGQYPGCGCVLPTACRRNG